MITTRSPRYLARWSIGIDATAGAAVALFARFCVAGLAQSPATTAAYLGIAGAGAVGSVLAFNDAFAPKPNRFPLAVRSTLLPAVFAALWVIAKTGFSSPVLTETTFTVGLWALLLALLQTLARVNGQRSPAELVRLLLIGGFAVGAVAPYVTNLLVGRVDARWYAYVFRDFLDQWRTGSFPVFLGQGEFAFTGAVHPFRSAPFHMYLGGILDWLTFKHLDSLALQHATVVVCILIAGYGMYMGLVSLVPRARWQAASTAVLYVLCPGILAPLYCTDMYMTFMAIAVLPIIVVGNARAYRERDFGYLTLAVGLALVWYCHPPTALRCTLLSALIQIPRLTSLRAIQARWRTLLSGILLFAGLSCYYFASMSEVPMRQPLPLANELIQIGGMVLIVSGAFGWLEGSQWRYFAGMGLGLGLLWQSRSPWFLWGDWTLLLVLAGALCAHVCNRTVRAWRWEIMVAGLVLSAVAMELAIPGVGGGGNPETVSYLAENRLKLAMVLRPIRAGSHYRWPEYQLGWALLAGMLCVLILALSRRRNDLRWLVLPVIGLAALQFPVPLLSDFYTTYFPTNLAWVMRLGEPQRELPVLAAFAAVGAFLAIGDVRRRVTAYICMIGLVMAVAWSAHEIRAFHLRAKSTTFSRAVTQDLFRAENILIYPFAYDLVPIPSYFRGGRIDWRMESRFFDEQGNLLIGPREIAAAMQGEAARRVSFRAQNAGNGPHAFNLSPVLRLEAHQRLLLRFDDHKNLPRGQIILHGTHLINEGMPGFISRAEFDELGQKSGVITLLNTSDRAEDFSLEFLAQTNHVLPEDGVFGTATLIPYDEQKAPIRLDSFTPYRAVVRAPQSGVLETPRIFLPGYQAFIDGQRADVLQSPGKLVSIRIPAGEHTVQLEYVGPLARWFRSEHIK